MKDFAAAYKLKIQYNTYIKNVTKKDDQYQLKDDDKNEYTCKKLIVRSVIILWNYNTLLLIFLILSQTGYGVL